MAKNPGQKETLRKVLCHVRPYWVALIVSLILALVYVTMSLYIPILVGRAVDHIIDAGKVDFHGVWDHLILVAICACVAGISQWIMNELNNRVTYRVTKDIRTEAFRHIQRMPLMYLDGHPHGDVVSRVISDVDTFADGLLMGFTQLFTGVMTILGTLVFMVMISWEIALVVVCVTPLSLLVANFISKRTYSMFQLQSKTRGEQTSLVDEVVGNLKVVKAFGHEDETLEQFDEINDRLKNASLRAIFFSSLTNPGTRFVYSVVYAFVALFGAFLTIAGGISVGNLTSFLSYANQYTKPFNEVSGILAELQNALACAGRVFALMEEPAMPADPEEPDYPEAVQGGMQIRDLSFRYAPDRPLIEDLNLDIQPGQRVAWHWR